MTMFESEAFRDCGSLPRRPAAADSPTDRYKIFQARHTKRDQEKGAFREMPPTREHLYRLLRESERTISNWGIKNPVLTEGNFDSRFLHPCRLVRLGRQSARWART